MKYLSNLTFLICVLFISCTQEKKAEEKSIQKAEYAIVLHGGAGNMNREKISAEKESLYKQELLAALEIGENILKNGGTSTKAVEMTIRYLEDCPLFNAGKGAVFTHDGHNELDASFMDGKTHNAGAVAGVRDIKNPISAAIEVMNNSKHVMLSGDGASQFAKEQKLEIVDPNYFKTEDRWKALQKQLKKNKVDKHGTVGCVALDKEGNLAAGTSTGGMSNKKYGRIGDSPVIGAGTYADNATCGVSCTGHGEYFIRYTVAKDISALMAYKGLSLEKASRLVVQDKLVKAGGSGGIIAIDSIGNISMEFNTSGMFRAYAKANGERDTRIFK